MVRTDRSSRMAVALPSLLRLITLSARDMKMRHQRRKHGLPLRPSFFAFWAICVGISLSRVQVSLPCSTRRSSLARGGGLAMLRAHLCTLFCQLLFKLRYLSSLLPHESKRSEPANQCKRMLHFSCSLPTTFVCKRMDFSHLNVRRVVRQVAQTENPSQYLIDWDVAIRRKAMALTSNSRNEAAVPQVLAQIAEECNECGYILVDVMAVIWERIRDSRSTQWKHGLFALQLLRELLLHGPITAVTEAEDGHRQDS